MGENSKISWTHHTWNPWWGCHRLSAGQFRRLVLRSLVSGLLVLALAGCGSEGGGGEDGPVECTEQEGLAPCCDATPLTADDCPEGTAFSSDEFGECCKDAAGDHGICRAAAEDGSTVSRSEAGVRSILCDWTTGREVAESDLAGACVVACYDDDGHKVARSGCDSSRVSDRAPACPGYE